MRKLRPIKREISWVRPFGHRFSRLRRECVLLGSIAYSAVNQPCGLGSFCNQRGKFVFNGHITQHMGLPKFSED